MEIDTEVKAMLEKLDIPVPSRRLNTPISPGGSKRFIEDNPNLTPEAKAMLNKARLAFKVEMVWPDCTGWVLFTDPNISLLLVPWFIPYVNKVSSLVEVGLELNERMCRQPDRTYVGAAVRPNGTASAILVAYCRESDVFAWQAHYLPGFKYAREVFEHLVGWTISKGFDRIRLKTDARRERFFERKYGFRLCGSENGVMEYDVF